MCGCVVLDGFYMFLHVLSFKIALDGFAGGFVGGSGCLYCGCFSAPVFPLSTLGLLWVHSGFAFCSSLCG